MSSNIYHTAAITKRILGPIRVLKRAGPRKPFNQSVVFAQGRKTEILLYYSIKRHLWMRCPQI